MPKCLFHVYHINGDITVSGINIIMGTSTYEIYRYIEM